MATENTFPTISDLHMFLGGLIESGLGALPTQVTVVPDSTLQAVAKIVAGGAIPIKPALMIESGSVDGRMGAMLVSCDYLTDNGMKTRAEH